MDNKKLTPIVLIAGAVVIAVSAVGYTVWNESKPGNTAQPSTQAPSTQAPSTQAPSTQDPAAQTPQTGQTADAGPQTEVPEGTTLEAYVTKYYEAIKNKDYETAFNMQAASKKASSTVDSFKQTQESYGITSFEVGKANEDGESTTVEAKLNLEKYGTWYSIWTFNKKDGKWLLVDQRSGMKQ